MWLRIVWQTGATSEHRLQRRVHTDRDYIDIGRLRKRIVELNAAGKMDKEIAAILNRESLRRCSRLCVQGRECLAYHGPAGTFRLSKSMAQEPIRCAGPDGTFSVQGAAAALGITAQTVFDYLERGLLSG